MLRSALEKYISMREAEKEFSGKENMHSFFCMPLGYSCAQKVAAAKRLLSELNGNEYVRYSVDDFYCLDNGRLGKIFKSHQNEVPAAFTLQKEEHQEQMRELERDAMREYVFGWRGMA